MIFSHFYCVVVNTEHIKSVVFRWMGTQWNWKVDSEYTYGRNRNIRYKFFWINVMFVFYGLWYLTLYIYITPHTLFVHICCIFVYAELSSIWYLQSDSFTKENPIKNYIQCDDLKMIPVGEHTNKTYWFKILVVYTEYHFKIV